MYKVGGAAALILEGRLLLLVLEKLENPRTPLRIDINSQQDHGMS